MTSVDLSQWRVLVVDDDAGMRETLSDILAAESIRTVTAGTGEAAEEVMKLGQVALAILDQMFTLLHSDLDKP